ncbi:alpha/beta hydrolase fold domain-containing protein [Candidatus Gracilibacteria bacterium]|nr:alpha/beta hydrolase fold domain-containing protein [Candidatus Gracilibacteria bacterium]
MKKLLFLPLLISIFGIGFLRAYDQELVQAYDYAYDMGITTMPNINQANMYGNLQRSHMAKMVANYATDVLGLVPDTGKICEFSDIDNESDELKGYITKACRLGLMGIGISKFEPKGIVTRAQFGTVLSRALRGDIYNEGNPYYGRHLKALRAKGIMNNIDNPNLTEKRGYVMLMMERADENYEAPEIIDEEDEINNDLVDLSDNPPNSNVSVTDKNMYSNIVYDTQEGVSLKLHLLVPERSDGKDAPLLLTFSAKEVKLSENSLDLLEQEMIERGYAIGKASLRFYEEDSKFPDAYVDAKSAVRYIKANASQYGINPDKIAVMGSSKNGLIAAAIGTMGEEIQYDIGKNLNYNSKVAAVINFAGHTDLTNFYQDGMDDPQVKMDEKTYEAKNQQFLGCPAFECDETEAAASSINYIDEEDPPFYMMIGSEDNLVPKIQLERFKDKCDDEGVAAYFEVVDGAPHSVERYLEQKHVNRLVSFLVEYVE